MGQRLFKLHEVTQHSRYINFVCRPQKLELMHQNKPLNTVIVKDRILLCSQTAALLVISRLGTFSISVAVETIPAEDKAFQEILQFLRHISGQWRRLIISCSLLIIDC